VSPKVLVLVPGLHAGGAIPDVFNVAGDLDLAHADELSTEGKQFIHEAQGIVDGRQSMRPM